MKEWLILTDCVVRNEEIHSIKIKFVSSVKYCHQAIAYDSEDCFLGIVAIAASEEDLREKLEKILNG